MTRLAIPMAATAPDANDAAHADRGVLQLGGGDHPVDEPDGEGLVRLHLPPTPDELLRPRRTDQPGQALRRPRARDDAEKDLGLPDAHVVGGDPQVARHCQLEAAAERDAVDGGDDRPRDLAEGVVRGPKPRPDGACLGRTAELADVGPGRERLGPAEDDDGLHVGIAGEVAGGGSDLVEQRRRQRVERRPVDAKDGDAVVAAVGADTVGHEVSPLTRS